MNRFIKLSALAVIMAFAVIACAPEADITSYSWSKVNARDNPANGGNVALPELAEAGVPADVKNPKITIMFPFQADILRASKIEEELKKFLTVYTFEDPLDTNSGSVSRLSLPIDYKFVRTFNENIAEIQLERDFTGNVHSDLAVKIDGTKYTYSRGFKMDVDQNGVGGEEIYDDLYLVQSLTGSVSTTLIPPGQRFFNFLFNDSALTGIAISLMDPSNWSPVTQSNSLEISEFAAIYFHIDDIYYGTPGGQVIYKAIGDQFAGGFKLQEYSNGAWSDVKTAVYDPLSDHNKLYFKNITIKNAVPYRIRWTGSANLETNGTYFGVKQRPYIWLGGPSDIPSNKVLFAQTEAATGSVIFTNSDIYEEITAISAPTLYSCDNTGRNAVIKFTFPIKGAGTLTAPYVGLKELPLADFQGNNAAFKVYSAFTNLDAALSGGAGNNLVKIEKVEYRKEGLDPVNALNNNVTYINALYVTIDPKVAYNASTFKILINNKFAYEGTSVTRVFGDASLYAYGGYREY